MAKEKLKEKKQMEMAKKPESVVATHGRIFKGEVTRKFPGRVTIEMERTVRVPKYERFLKKKTRIHARLPETLDVQIGDLIKVRESRPLSKTIHFVVIEIVKKAEEK